MDLTLSEALFEALCKQEGFPLRRVPPREGVRTPDYLVGPLFKRIVVEVKQLEPSPEEQEKQAAWDAGDVVLFGGVPGAHVRKAIDDGYPQIRRMTHGCRPGILVLYDNYPPPPRRYLDPEAIRVGIYGLEQVLIAPDMNESVRSRFVDIVFGPKQKVGPRHNRALSAVGRLYQDSADHIALDLFQNVYATVRLNPSRLSGSAVRHHRLEVKRLGMSQEWERIRVR
jgi:hypothetical protein